MSKTKSKTYSDVEIAYIVQLKQEGKDWKSICTSLNRTYHTNYTAESVRHAFRRYGNLFDLNDNKAKVDQLRDIVSTKKQNSKISKENLQLLEYLNLNDDIIEKMESLLNNVKLSKIKISKPKVSKTKKEMIIEPMFSDLHVGEKTESYNVDVAEKRITHYTETILDEIVRCEKNYNINKLILLFMGDFMQSTSMHPDSGQSCDLTNAEQIVEAIRILYYRVLVPLGKTGKKIQIEAICGNHDRTEKNQHTVEPGKTYMTWVMYNSLNMMCKISGLKNITFNIPSAPYSIYKVFDEYYTVEHGHECSQRSETGLMTLLTRRANQVEKILKGIRIGHYHHSTIFGFGRGIINGSTVSNDGYAESKGFSSIPGQMINYYVKTQNRSTTYYHSFPVNLGGIK